MRRLVYGMAMSLALAHPVAAERIVTDSAGRKVAVPDRIERVFAAEPPASILLYILAPDRMIGWPRGPSGLETGLKGSINTEIIERVGATNVAVDPSGARRGIVQVSVEQIVLWNPDTVITWDPNFYDGVWKDFYWQAVDAVAAGRVYLSPTAPFGWVDRPPSLNRVIGLKWLAGLFYPDKVKQDSREVTRSFYDLFYHVDLTDAELDRLLQWAEGRTP